MKVIGLHNSTLGPIIEYLSIAHPLFQERTLNICAIKCSPLSPIAVLLKTYTEGGVQ